MTVIVYDGRNKTLSADTMATATTSDATSKLDAVFKITDLSKDKLTFGDEKLLAFAGAGMLSGIRSAFEMVVRNFRNWNELRNYVGQMNLNYAAAEHCDCILVTSKTVFEFHFSRRELQIYEMEQDEFVTIGSGALAAATAMRVFGLTGEQAVVAAGLVDRACGTMVTTYDITADALVPRHPTSTPNDPMSFMKLRKLAAKSTVIHGEAPGPLVSTTFDYSIKSIQDSLNGIYKRAVEGGTDQPIPPVKKTRVRKPKTVITETPPTVIPEPSPAKTAEKVKRAKKAPVVKES